MKRNGVGNVAQLVEHLPDVHEVLSLIPSIAKTRCNPSTQEDQEIQVVLSYI